MSRRQFVTIGIDEVGRGAWAGPMLLSAVINYQFDWRRYFSPAKLGWQWQKLVVRDSKRLSDKQRLDVWQWYQKQPGMQLVHQWVEVEQIEDWGIKSAWQWGLGQLINQVLAELEQPARIYLDGNWGPRSADLLAWQAQGVVCNHQPTWQQPAGKPRVKLITQVKADSRVWEVALASILAKVIRDQWMTKLADQFPVYAWQDNKGYGTRQHRQAIQQHGLTKHHRASWLKGI